MKIKVEALVELTVEVPEKSDTDVIVAEAKVRLTKLINPKDLRMMDDVVSGFKIIIIGKE